MSKRRSNNETNRPLADDMHYALGVADNIAEQVALTASMARAFLNMLEDREWLAYLHKGESMKKSCFPRRINLLIMDCLIWELWRDQLVDISQDREALTRLLEAVEKAEAEVATYPVSIIEVKGLAYNLRGDLIHYRTKLTRANIVKLSAYAAECTIPPKLLTYYRDMSQEDICTRPPEELDSGATAALQRECMALRAQVKALWEALRARAKAYAT